MPVTDRVNPESKAERVVDELRSRIVAGHLSPGSQLPTWDDMVRHFRVTRPTLTRAMERLKRDGFIHATRARGTFVADRLPHLTRFGVVFSSSPTWTFSGLGGWNRFWDLLAMTVPALEKDLDLELPLFFEVISPQSRGAIRLAGELRRGRLGGLILVGTHELLAVPAINRADVPRVGIYDLPERVDFPCVYVDSQSFVDRSLDALAERGRRRVAILTNETATFGMFEQALAQRGLQSKPFWRLMINPACARNVVRLLLDHPPQDRPDALIVADDHLVEQALAGVIAAGVRVPEELAVVTHCNWPRPPANPVPTVQLGYDARAILRTSIDLLQHQRQGDTPAHMTRVPARLNSEVELGVDVPR